MANFRCINKECKKFMEPVNVWTLNWPYELESKRIADITCECKEKMECIPYGEPSKGATILKFDSLPPEKKKAMLKERADRAYKKNGEAEKKREKIINTIKKHQK